MTAHSVSMARVAQGISSIALIIVLSFTSYGQSTTEDSFQKVTVIGHNMHFEDVLEQLTLQTRIHFIYSSSMVSLDKPVTLLARQQSLKNVLNDLSVQMNVTFKRQGDYFIVKRNIASTILKTTFTVAQPSLANSEELQDETALEPENIPAETNIDQSNLTVREDAITKDLLKLAEGLDPKRKLKYLPLLAAEKNSSPLRRNWFASAGIFLNDYSVGIETQFGLPLLHGIVNAGMLGDGVYRIGYGLGTALPLKPGLTANVAYTFASVRRDGFDSWQNEYQATANHHQIRASLNILLSDHFSIRVGPTFNVLRTSYDYTPEIQGAVTSLRNRPAPSQQYLSSSSGYPNTVYYQAATLTPPDDKTARSWIGFEAGVAYRLNFSLIK